jgi:hypothetical protein
MDAERVPCFFQDRARRYLMAAAISSAIGSPGALHATIASDRRHDPELGKDERGPH